MNEPRRERLILAVCDVMGFTRVCQTRDDLEIFGQLGSYYALVAREIAPAGGRVLKCIGDAALLTFPLRDRDAVMERLRGLEEKADALWQAFDGACTVEVKAGIGEVVVGPLGPPGDERPDAIGSALNTLFRARGTDFDVDGELRELPRA